jgi:hypothetical protein
VIGSLTTAATGALSALLYRSCQRQVPTQSTSAETWANSGSAFSCNYEESSPSAQGALDYAAGAGYGYDVWTLPSQTVNAGDRIVVDSMTFKVLEAAAVGAPGPLKRLRTQRIA